MEKNLNELSQIEPTSQTENIVSATSSQKKASKRLLFLFSLASLLLLIQIPLVLMAAGKFELEPSIEKLNQFIVARQKQKQITQNTQEKEEIDRIEKSPKITEENQKLLKEIQYLKGIIALKESRWQEAEQYFDSVESYKDSSILKKYSKAQIVLGVQPNLTNYEQVVKILSDIPLDYEGDIKQDVISLVQSTKNEYVKLVEGIKRKESEAQKRERYSKPFTRNQAVKLIESLQHDIITVTPFPKYDTKFNGNYYYCLQYETSLKSVRILFVERSTGSIYGASFESDTIEPDFTIQLYK